MYICFFTLIWHDSVYKVCVAIAKSVGGDNEGSHTLASSQHFPILNNHVVGVPHFQPFPDILKWALFIVSSQLLMVKSPCFTMVNLVGG